MTSVPLVSVYRFEVWSQEAGGYVLAPRYGTAAAIQQIGGRLQEDSQLTVSTGDLDGNGLYPKAGVWLVEVVDVVYRIHEGARVVVPEGPYRMERVSSGSFTLAGDGVPLPFHMDGAAVNSYVPNKIRISTGHWP